MKKALYGLSKLHEHGTVNLIITFKKMTSQEVKMSLPFCEQAM